MLYLKNKCCFEATIGTYIAILKKPNQGKQVWVSLLEAAGMDDTGMKKWHIKFGKTSTEAHQDFLESIGIEAAEIVRIRASSKSGDISI